MFLTTTVLLLIFYLIFDIIFIIYLFWWIMDFKNDKEILDLILKQSQKSYEDIEIAGMPEHNAQVQEKRTERLYQSENELTRQQLQALNNNLQKQINEAKEEALSAKRQTRTATFLSIIGIAVPSVISLAALIVSIVK